nr:hypothetical protein CFP56_12318 [Quercus suber]
MPRAQIKKESGKSGASSETEETAPHTFAMPALSCQSLRMAYQIARGEQGVLTFEPYKSILLPHWRFRTPAIAESSSAMLYSAFRCYVDAGDFVGADMSRKFIQMGMTRAKRYANHKGGKKYDRSAREVEKEGGERKELERSKGHVGMEEKEQASAIFREVWKRACADEKYLELKKEFQKEQKIWDKENKPGNDVKKEQEAAERKRKVKEENVE